MFRVMVAVHPQIAIVEDDPAMLQAIGRLCGAAELPFRSFSSSEEFLASDGVQSSSFLILDIQLPGLSGFELHEQLQHRGIELPVIFITGQDRPQNLEKARLAGGAYLTKPFPATELLEAMRGLWPSEDDFPSPRTQALPQIP